MITSREVANAANEWQLRHDVVEKDYMLGWLLAGIATHPVTDRWAFKGGTCLRKSWFETYRFSEDLDFTVGPDDLDPLRLVEVFGEIGAWLLDRCGLVIRIDESSFRKRQNKRGQPTIQGRIAYVGPLASPSTPKVKLDLTADEVLVRPLERRPVFHPFSDMNLSGHRSDHLTDVLSYSLPELMGEKLRALAERCRPRDLYDVIHTHRHPDLVGRAPDVLAVLVQKCAHAGIETPTLESIGDRLPIRDRDRVAEHARPPAALTFRHSRPSGPNSTTSSPGSRASVAVPILRADPGRSRRHPLGVPPGQRRPGDTGAPLQLIRFAGSRTGSRSRWITGRQAAARPAARRALLPPSTRDGYLLLFVGNDRGQLRSYRVDRIRGASIEPETFTPRYRIEFRPADQPVA